MRTFLASWATILMSSAVERAAIRAAIAAMERGVVARRAYVSRTGARCPMALILPNVRSRHDRHAALRRLDPLRGEILVALSNFFVISYDASIHWPREKQHMLERQLISACRSELRRRSEVNSAATASRSGLAAAFKFAW